MGHFQLSSGLLKLVRGATSSSPFRYQKVNQEKDPANSQEQNEERQLENEQQNPLNKTERDMINPKKTVVY